MDNKEYFEILQLFVPVAHQNTAQNFVAYLKSLTNRQDIQYYSIHSQKRGIEVIQYRPHYTPSDFFTWSDLSRNIIEPQFKPAPKLGVVQFGDLFVQLDNAF